MSSPVCTPLFPLSVFQVMPFTFFFFIGRVVFSGMKVFLTGKIVGLGFRPWSWISIYFTTGSEAQLMKEFPSQNFLYYRKLCVLYWNLTISTKYMITSDFYQICKNTCKPFLANWLWLQMVWIHNYKDKKPCFTYIPI